jgi:transcriptional regulator with XRE-family HTH domain
MFKSKQQKEEMARRLGVSVRALEQYMHLKRVESGAPTVATPKIDREALEAQRPVKRDITY